MPHSSSAQDRPATRGLLAGLGVLALVSAILFWRGPLAAVPVVGHAVRLAGWAAGPVDPVLSGVDARWTAAGLTVSGTLGNPGPERIDVPRLRITIRDGASQILYSVIGQAPRAQLAPGERITFTRALGAVPGQGRDLAVDFVADRTATSGAGAEGVR